MELLEVIETLHATIPFPKGRFVEGAAPPLVPFAWNDDADLPLAEIAAQATAFVAFVGTDAVRTQTRATSPLCCDGILFESCLRLHRFMTASPGKVEDQRLPLTVDFEHCKSPLN